MPLHRIYHHPSAFSAEDKKAIAERVTQCYAGLPAFYVVVLFVDVDESSFYVGGKSVTNFVRIVSQHLARSFSTAETRNFFIGKLEDAWAPYIKDRGLDWESHIEDTPRESWRENGISPPMPGTDEEKLWRKENRPIPF